MVNGSAATGITEKLDGKAEILFQENVPRYAWPEGKTSSYDSRPFGCPSSETWFISRAGHGMDARAHGVLPSSVEREVGYHGRQLVGLGDVTMYSNCCKTYLDRSAWRVGSGEPSARG